MTQAGIGEVVFHGGRVTTMDDRQPFAEAVAIRAGRIVAVGDDRTVLAEVGQNARRIDLRGRSLLPGFQDAHVHPVTSGLERLRCDLNDGRTVEDYQRIVADYAARFPERGVVVGGGWSLSAFPGGTPSRALLDAIVSDRPVVLDNRDGHGSWVNTRALELAGIDASTPDPAGGRIERDAEGFPQGTLHEAAMGLVQRHLPKDPAEDWLAGARLGQAELHRLGITAWLEASGRTPIMAAYRTLAEQGELTGRVTVAQYWHPEQGPEQLEGLLERRANHAIGRLRADRVKLFLDGIVENFTAAMLDSYLDADGRPSSNHGISTFTPAALREVVRLVDATGFHVHCHAIGDRAVRDALDAIELALAANPARERRHTIAHIQVVHPDDVPRFRRLDVVADGQPLWAVRDDQMAILTEPFLGPERSAWQYPFGSLLRAGARLAFGSDWSVSTADPLPQMEVATRRVWPGDRDAAPFYPAECITLMEAARAFTLGSAYVNGLDETGSIERGKLADVVVLDRDLFAPDMLPADARVLLTMVGGEAVYEDPALEA